VSLLEEIKRRKVFRVAIAYLAVAWLVVQVAETLLPAYDVPDSALRLLVAVLSLGLVIALVLAWIFDWTPRGPEITPDSDAVNAHDRPQRAPNLVIAALVVVAALFAAWLTFRAVDPAAISERSVAVLPFKTLGQADADVFTEGIHVGVVSRLTAVADLDVISRTSVLVFRDSEQPLPDIAQALGVNWVVNAEVQQAGEEVLITARLVDARTDRQVWAQDYRRLLSATDVFAVQADIAARIIEAVDAQLTDREQDRVALVPTESLDAYRLYQQGRIHLEQRTGPAVAESLAYFEQALTLDPEYALAWAGLAEGLAIQLAYALIEDNGELAMAQGAIDRALQLDPGLAEAWVARGLLEYLQRRAPAALRAYERAVALRPGLAHAQSLLSFQFSLQGDKEKALESIRKAVRLNPFSAEAWSNLAAGSVSMGQNDAALAAAERAFELAPDWSNVGLMLGMVQFYTGDYASAASQLEGVTVPWTGAGAETLLARSLVRLGRVDAARAVIPTMEAVGDEYALASLEAELGDRDAAYERLFRIETWDDFATLAFRNLDGSLWDPEGNDERYRAVLARVDASWGIDGN
jgi:TolB-like protein/Tfp pilus assembly protein PilF